MTRGGNRFTDTCTAARKHSSCCSTATKKQNSCCSIAPPLPTVWGAERQDTPHQVLLSPPTVPPHSICLLLLAAKKGWVGEHHGGGGYARIRLCAAFSLPPTEKWACDGFTISLKGTTVSPRVWQHARVESSLKKTPHRKRTYEVPAERNAE